MSTPVVTPSKAKAVVGLIGSLLSVAAPLILQVSTSLPAPWPALVGGVFAVLTMFGVYKAPYKPQGTVLVPAADAPPETYTNPYRP